MGQLTTIQLQPRRCVAVRVGITRWTPRRNEAATMFGVRTYNTCHSWFITLFSCFFSLSFFLPCALRTRKHQALRPRHHPFVNSPPRNKGWISQLGREDWIHSGITANRFCCRPKAGSCSRGNPRFAPHLICFSLLRRRQFQRRPNGPILSI